MPKINPTATLDTNVLVEHWKNRNKAAITRTLLDLAKSGLLDLAACLRIDQLAVLVSRDYPAATVLAWCG